MMYTSYAGSACSYTPQIRGADFLLFFFFFFFHRWNESCGKVSHFRQKDLGLFQILSSRKSISDTIMMQTMVTTSRPGKQLIIHISVSFKGWGCEAQPSYKVSRCKKKVLIIVSLCQLESQDSLVSLSILWRSEVVKETVSLSNHLFSSLLWKNASRLFPKNCDTQIHEIK